MSGLFSTYQNSTNITKGLVNAGVTAVAGLIVVNMNAGLRYFQLHNKATAPVATEVPALWFPVPAGTAAAPGYLELNMAFFGDYERFQLGLGWAVSSTSATFTDALTGSNYLETVRWRAA